MIDQPSQMLEGLIFAELFKSKKYINPYIFHTNYKISPAQIALFVNKYKDSGLIEISPYGRLKLTHEGLKVILKQRKMFFINRQLDYSKFIPSDVYTSENKSSKSFLLPEEIEKIKKNQLV